MAKAIKVQKRYRRHHRIRAKVFGVKERPRLCIFRSNQHIYAQVIDDEAGRTLTAASDLEVEINVRRRHPERSLAKRGQAKDPGFKKKPQTGKTATAFEVGKLIARKALKKKIKQVIFDRGGYKYHGRVKALARGAREQGLEF